MQLFYSGAETSNTSQPVPSKSLGGYPSLSPVPNAKTGNIFSTISRSAVESGQIETRLVVLKNTTGVITQGVKIWLETPIESPLKIIIAAVASALDDCNKPIFEQIFAGDSLPLQATLEQHETESNAITIGNMEIGAMVGVWLSKTIDKTKLPEFFDENNLTDDQLVAALQQSTNKDPDVVNLKISYT